MNPIKYLIMDVDGTLTDGKIYMGNNGEICKAFDIKDGYGIHDILIPANIRPIIITCRRSQILENRCKELEITELFQGTKDKVTCLEKLLSKNSSQFCNVAYIGDDENDLACMKVVKENGGIVGCPADAVKSVIEISDFVSVRSGGNGAVREFIEWFINESPNSPAMLGRIV